MDLACRYPDNMLLRGRGQPGTHNTALLVGVLNNIRSAVATELPVYDKSLHGGEGDRASSTVHVEPPVDVFVLEGWSMGFQPLSAEALRSRYNDERAGTPPRAHMMGHSLAALGQINDNLSRFSTAIYPLFDVHVTLRAGAREYVYRWRLQQESAMKERNGGEGMSDEQVAAFVDRYMPGYELFESGMDDYWGGKSLIVDLGHDRVVVAHREA